MRENCKQFSRTGFARHNRQLWMLALGVSLLPLFALPAMAETFTLKSVDFASEGDRTDIILHTGSIVPVQKVMVTDNKLIIEVDQIDANETIRTNFSGAANISHVIMQPVNDHKIRMIVRGENLGSPSVAFFNANNGAYGSTNPGYRADRLGEETATALHALQEAGMKPATLDESAISGKPGNAEIGETAAVGLDNAPLPTADDISNAEPAEKTTETSRFGNLNPEPIDAGTGKTRPDNAKTEDLSPLSISEQPAGGAAVGFLEALAKPAIARHYEPYIPYGILGLVVIGLGGFIAHRIRRFRRNEMQLEDYIQEQAQGKKVSFQEMASAYRSKHGKPSPETDPPSDTKTFASVPVGPARKPSGDSLIGLGGLKQIERPLRPENPEHRENSEAMDLGATKKLEALLQAMQQQAGTQKKAVPTPAPKKQALSQYLKSQPQPQPKLQPQLQVQAQPQQAAAPAKPRSREAADAAMLQEMRRREQERAELLQANIGQQIRQPDFPNVPSATVKSAKKASRPGVIPPSMPVNRAPAARKQAGTNPLPSGGGQPKAQGGQGPLPGNPEVLNFLRNVADLMEKDGKPAIAKSIHKNLSTQNLGMS